MTLNLRKVGAPREVGRPATRRGATTRNRATREVGCLVVATPSETHPILEPPARDATISDLIATAFARCSKGHRFGRAQQRSRRSLASRLYRA